MSVTRDNPHESVQEYRTCQTCRSEYPFDRDEQESEVMCPVCYERVEDGTNPIRIEIDIDSEGRVWVTGYEGGLATGSERMHTAAEGIALCLELFAGGISSDEYGAALRGAGKALHGEDAIERARRLAR